VICLLVRADLRGAYLSHNKHPSLETAAAPGKGVGLTLEEGMHLAHSKRR
jgi:hypothetical protein